MVSSVMQVGGAAASIFGFVATALFVVFGVELWAPMDPAKTAAAREAISIAFFAVCFVAAVVAGAVSAIRHFDRS